MKIIQLTNMTPIQTMGYVVQARTGELLVIDGGDKGNGAELARVIRKAGGHVSLWLITHPHDDHHTAVMEVLSDPNGITYDRLGASQLPDTWIGGSETEQNGLTEWNRFAKDLPNYFKVEAGQTFDVGSMRVEVLTGANPDLNWGSAAFNQQSCVYRVTEDGFTMLFLGDLYIESGERLMAAAADLRADAVQMAHHGQNGVSEDVYRAIRPRYAFWPTPRWLWDNLGDAGNGEMKPGMGPFKTPEVIGWMEKLNAVPVTSFDYTVMFDSETEKIVRY